MGFGTFSIVAADPAAGECGVAVASKFLSVGAVVPWARAGIGAVATQADASTAYGPEGLSLLERGLHPEEVVATLTGRDPESANRQFGIVDMQGRAATFTGRSCFAWAGGVAGAQMAAQGNILVSEATVTAMREAFQRPASTLAARLLAALTAGDAAGGDRRGKQSAALLVVKPNGGYGGRNDRYLDLRVDDHGEPAKELARLYDLWRLYFETPGEDELTDIDPALAAELRSGLRRLGYEVGSDDAGPWNEPAQAAFKEFSEKENLEEHLRADRRTDQRVLRYFRELVAGRRFD